MPPTPSTIPPRPSSPPTGPPPSAASTTQRSSAPPPNPHRASVPVRGASCHHLRGSIMRTRRTLITAAIMLVAVPSAAAVAAPAAAAFARGAGQASPAGRAGPAATGTKVVVSTTASHVGRVLLTGAGPSLHVLSGD